MLQIPSSNQVTAHPRRFNSPSIVPFHSTLTAALQASGSGNAFPEQLSPVSQVADLAGRGEDQEQYRSSFNACFPAQNLKYVGTYRYIGERKRLIEVSDLEKTSQSRSPSMTMPCTTRRNTIHLGPAKGPHGIILELSRLQSRKSNRSSVDLEQCFKIYSIDLQTH